MPILGSYPFGTPLGFTGANGNERPTQTTPRRDRDADLVLLLQSEQTHGSQFFQDDSVYHHRLTPASNAPQHSTNIAPGLTASSHTTIHFNGSAAQHLAGVVDSQLDFARTLTGAVEFWCYPLSQSSAHALDGTILRLPNLVVSYNNNAGTQTKVTWTPLLISVRLSADKVPLGQWSHVSINIDGQYLRLLINDTLQSISNPTAPTSRLGQSFSVGSNDGAVLSFDGYLDSLEISRIARRSAAGVVELPTSLYNTPDIVHLEGYAQAGRSMADAKPFDGHFTLGDSNGIRRAVNGDFSLGNSYGVRRALNGYFTAQAAISGIKPFTADVQTTDNTDQHRAFNAYFLSYDTFTAQYPLIPVVSLHTRQRQQLQRGLRGLQPAQMQLGLRGKVRLAIEWHTVLHCQHRQQAFAPVSMGLHSQTRHQLQRAWIAKTRSLIELHTVLHCQHRQQAFAPVSMGLHSQTRHQLQRAWIAKTRSLIELHTSLHCQHRQQAFAPVSMGLHSQTRHQLQRAWIAKTRSLIELHTSLHCQHRQQAFAPVSMGLHSQTRHQLQRAWIAKTRSLIELHTSLHCQHRQQAFTPVSMGLHSQTRHQYYKFLHAKTRNIISNHLYLSSKQRHAVEVAVGFCGRTRHASHEPMQKALHCLTRMQGHVPLPIITGAAYLSHQGTRYSITSYSLKDDNDSSGISGSVSLAEVAAVSFIRSGDIVSLIEGDTAQLFVANAPSFDRQATKSGIEISPQLELLPMSALLDEPFAHPVTQVWTEAALASEIAQALVGDFNLRWALVDWVVKANRLAVQAMTPLAILKKLVASVGGTIAVDHDGTIVCQPRHGRSVPQWYEGAADRILSDELNNLSMKKAGWSPQTRWDSVHITDIDPDAERQTTFEVRKQRNASATLRLYSIPWLDADKALILHTGSPNVFISDIREVYEQITEEIEFKEGKSSTSLPVHNFLSQRWLFHDLGEIAWQSGSKELLAFGGEGLKKGYSRCEVRYETRYLQCNVGGYYGTIQFLAVEL